MEKVRPEDTERMIQLLDRDGDSQVRYSGLKGDSKLPRCWQLAATMPYCTSGATSTNLHMPHSQRASQRTACIVWIMTQAASMSQTVTSASVSAADRLRGVSALCGLAASKPAVTRWHRVQLD